MIAREQLVKIARDVIGGNDRPEDECSGRVLQTCPLAVTNPAAHDIPAWVIESMRRAYRLGLEDGTPEPERFHGGPG